MIYGIRPPILMGLLMGLAMPWLMHVEDGGTSFVLAHVAVIGGAAALALLAPGLRRGLHRPALAHLPLMLIPAALAWGATCLYCLAIDGQHWS